MEVSRTPREYKVRLCWSVRGCWGCPVPALAPLCTSPSPLHSCRHPCSTLHSRSGLSVLFYVPQKIGIVPTWIHESIEFDTFVLCYFRIIFHFSTFSVENWNKIRHAYPLGFISQKVNHGKSSGGWTVCVPLSTFVLLFHKCLWYILRYFSDICRKKWYLN